MGEGQIDVHSRVTHSDLFHTMNVGRLGRACDTDYVVSRGYV